MKKNRKRTLAICLILLLVFIAANRQLKYHLFYNSRYEGRALDSGNIDVPHEREMVWKNHSAFADSVCDLWANKPFNDKMFIGKGNAPRIILAKLMARRDIPLVNKTIRRFKAWGISGTSWSLNKKGDYDFTIVVLTSIIWLYGDQPDLLYPSTQNYLLDTLLTEAGSKFRYTAPRTLGLAKETENHLLMTEGSRYLKNRWIMLHGNKDPYYNNVSNGMETRIIELLDEMQESGLYEFNSIPYEGYTITALLNLDAFASEAVRTEARNVLDYMNWCYALGSYKLKHYPPMRRRYEKEGIRELTTDYQSIFIKAWLSYTSIINFDKNISNGEVHALMGVCMPYRPPDRVVDLIFDKEAGYFIKLGHGAGACPEIYSAGKHFLISAGGVNRGKWSLIVPRPITIFFDDKADELSETIHLEGPGKDYMKWNNTGVYRNFACAAGPVFIPAGLLPVASDKNWSIYSMPDSVFVAVYSSESAGIIAVFDKPVENDLITGIEKANPDEAKLRTCFRFPSGPEISYDLNAPKDKWVIITAKDQPVDRNFDSWPLISGSFNN